jgi:hypothetical protein
MKKPSTKVKKKAIRRIIVLKGELPGAHFTRKQAEAAVKSEAQEQKLASKRACRQAKFEQREK